MNKNINIALVGFGNVGSYLFNKLKNNSKDIELKTGKKIKIVAISAKNLKKKRKYKLDKNIFYKNPLNILKKNKIDILFELIGFPDGISKKIVVEALKSKVHVITPNKALIAKHGEELSYLAEKNNVNLEFEAAVGGGTPIIRTIKEGLATNKISKVYGILNGTCNYILSEMEKSKDSFENVLKKAQNLGYAEPQDPKYDLNGSDTLNKIRILSSLSFNTKISQKECIMEGIDNIELKDIDIANQLNLRIKLLGIAEMLKNKLFERVHPCLVQKDTYISNVNGVMNAIILHGKPVGESILQGEGAGPGPTSSALLSDLLSILRGNIKYPFAIPFNKRKPVNKYNDDTYVNSFYIRLEVMDKPGVLSLITSRMTKFNISIKRLIQTPDKKKNKATIVIITHKTNELNFKKCMSIFNKNKNILRSPTIIRLFN